MHFRSPLATAKEVRQYQVVYRGDGLDLTIVLAEGADQELVRHQVTEALNEKLRHAGAEPPALRFDFVDSIARDPETMSKLKLVRSEPAVAGGSTGRE